MGESLILDPSEETSDRTELDITPYVAPQGPSFGDAAVANYMAEQSAGELPVDFRVPNRVIEIPLGLHGRTGMTFDEIRTKLQAKVGLWQRERGVIARENTRVGTVYADVVSATLRFGGSGLQAHGLQDTDAVLTLECLPDWWGAEVSASPAHSETTLPELVWTETGVEGDFPLGNRCRLVVTDLSGENQLRVVYGFRSRHYSAASTARLAYEAEAMTPVAPAAVATRAGASGGASNNVVAHTNLANNVWTEILTTDVSASRLTHRGTYRVLARVYSADVSAVRVRFKWTTRTFDDTAMGTGTPWRLPTGLQFVIADLGEVRLDAAPVGTHSWVGAIEARGDAGGEDIEIDRIWLVPLDESSGSALALTNGNALPEDKTLEIRTEGMFSESTTAGIYGPVEQTVGDFPRLPQSGTEGRTVEVFVKAARGLTSGIDGEVFDAGIDDIRGQLFYRATWLYIPDDTGS